MSSEATQEIMDWARIEAASVLDKLGIDLGDQNFKGTPKRWVEYLAGYLVPYDPKEDLSKTFEDPVGSVYEHSMVVQTNIPYRAVCAHHLIPVLGTAHVGYIPKNKVVGLSKLTRLVHGITHRMPSLQEDVCNEITHMIGQHLESLGSMCVIKAEHGCMAARGVSEPGVVTITSSVRGVFINKAEARAEFLKLAHI